MLAALGWNGGSRRSAGIDARGARLELMLAAPGWNGGSRARLPRTAFSAINAISVCAPAVSAAIARTVRKETQGAVARAGGAPQHVALPRANSFAQQRRSKVIQGDAGSPSR
jgi:hypothetical protein